ncbi:hypothetical protein TNCV_3305581 [Trichonephila clavipes]|nr:hypothetical protein TNCV_3305581 [Trichonephila clavipes]
MPKRRTSREIQLSATRSLRMSEPLASKTDQRFWNVWKGGGEFVLIIRRPSKQPVVALGEPPSLQCRTPSRHHLELQDRRDYTPADRAARTCWLGCPELLYYLAA